MDPMEAVAGAVVAGEAAAEAGVAGNQAELRASVFEAIEEEDKVIEKDKGLLSAPLGSCNDRAKQLHNSHSGRLLTPLVSEYLDCAQLNHTLKVYSPECNLPKESWKSELKDFCSKNEYDLNRNRDSGPLLLDVLEGFLKYEVRDSVEARCSSDYFLVGSQSSGTVWYGKDIHDCLRCLPGC